MNPPSHDSWLATETGHVIDLLDPDPRQITIEDIANSLSRIARFNGHTNRSYSVASHSMYVAELVPPHLKLQALLHDAAEAYVCDVPTPLKKMLGTAYSDIEERVARAIGRKFGVDLVEIHPTVKEADRIMVVTERDCLHTVPLKWSDEFENSVRYPMFDPKEDDPETTAQGFISDFIMYYRWAKGPFAPASSKPLESSQ